MEAIKSMIHDQYLPMYLWVEVAKTTIYVQNKLTRDALGNKTPEEMFTGEKTRFIHMKVFVCNIYLHVPKDKISKLDPHERREYFLDIVISQNHIEYIF